MDFEKFLKDKGKRRHKKYYYADMKRRALTPNLPHKYFRKSDGELKKIHRRRYKEIVKCRYSFDIEDIQEYLSITQGDVIVFPKSSSIIEYLEKQGNGKEFKNKWVKSI